MSAAPDGDQVVGHVRGRESRANDVIGVERGEGIDLFVAGKDRLPGLTIVPGLEDGVAIGADVGRWLPAQSAPRLSGYS